MAYGIVNIGVAPLAYGGPGLIDQTWLQGVMNGQNAWPPTIATQFGNGTGSFQEEGNIYRYTGPSLNPGGTAGDYVLATFTLPANSFDVAGRGISLMGVGNFAATSNNKTLKLIVGATSAVVGSAISGGTTIASSGVVTTSGGSWWIGANVFKYGVTGSNTQNATPNGVIAGATHLGYGSTASQALTLTESAPIICAITGNAATAATDISLFLFEMNAMN